MRMPASGSVSRKRPAISPSGSPTMSANSSAATVSVSVAPPFSTTSEPIVCPSVIVVPNLNRTAPQR
jgi:hypothetical protein